MKAEDCTNPFSAESGSSDAGRHLDWQAGYDKCAEELEVYLLKWRDAGRQDLVEKFNEYLNESITACNVPSVSECHKCTLEIKKDTYEWAKKNLERIRSVE